MRGYVCLAFSVLIRLAAGYDYRMKPAVQQVPFDPDFDGQKLMYHPGTVAQWLERGLTQGPVYTELALTDRCSCRCTFCGLDYRTNLSGVDLPPLVCKRVLRSLETMGNRSVMFSGEGEPLLHPRARELIAYSSARMSTSVTTTGLHLDEEALPLIDGLEWIRFSVNGGDAAAYSRVHGVGAGQFEKAMRHIGLAVERKRRLSLGVTIGVQLVLLPENAASVLPLARRVKRMGVDYFSVKPYSRHPMSGNRTVVDYSRFAGLRERVEALQDESFRVVYRAGSIAKLGGRKPYGRCLGTHFLCYISADGEVWECNVFLGDPRFRIGNVRRQALDDIWNGRRRRRVLRMIATELDLQRCRDVCRMDECNRYLWRLLHPRAHDNFI